MVLLFHVVKLGLILMNNKLCLVSLCPVTVLTHLSNYTVSHPNRANISLQSDLNHKHMIPSDLFTDTLKIKLLTHLTIRQRQNNPTTGLDRPQGFQEVEAPRFRDNQKKA